MFSSVPFSEFSVDSLLFSVVSVDWFSSVISPDSEVLPSSVYSTSDSSKLFVSIFSFVSSDSWISVSPDSSLLSVCSKFSSEPSSVLSALISSWFSTWDSSTLSPEFSSIFTSEFSSVVARKSYPSYPPELDRYENPFFWNLKKIIFPLPQ